MQDIENIVIIGGGQAGGTCATELRKKGFEGQLTVITEEKHIPYKRPPLSKAYLAGEAELDSLYVMKAAKLDDNNIQCKTGTRVEAIDRNNQTLRLADTKDSLPYDRLVIATGSRPRPLPLEGADKPNVFLFRSIDDVDAIRAQCTAGRKVTIIGGGFIGLEVAAVLVKQDMQVTVVEGLDRVLARVTAPPTSHFYQQVHRDAGVDLRLGSGVQSLEGDEKVEQVVLEDGSRIDTDLVVIGIGIVPNMELAQTAGLAVDNGITVDEYGRTDDPAIYAAGDCANHPSPMYKRRLRLESVQNAMDQARVVAANIAGEETKYDALPWFWSDQYDLKLQMVGISEGYDDAIVRGNPDDRSFSVFYLKGGELIAVDCISRPKDFMMAKKLVAAGLKPNSASLADESVELKSLLPE